MAGGDECLLTWENAAISLLSWKFAVVAWLTRSDPAAPLPAHLSLSLDPRLVAIEGGGKERATTRPA